MPNFGCRTVWLDFLMKTITPWPLIEIENSHLINSKIYLFNITEITVMVKLFAGDMNHNDSLLWFCQIINSEIWFNVFKVFSAQEVFFM